MLKPLLDRAHLAPSAMISHGSYSRNESLPSSSLQAPALRYQRSRDAKICCSVSSIQALEQPVEKTVAVKAVVTVKLTASGLFSNLTLSGARNAVTDLLGRTLLLELVSNEVDQNTGVEKATIQAFARKARVNKETSEVEYEANFKIDGSFGLVGGIFVTNEQSKEMYLKEIVLSGFADGPVTFTCDSWVHAKSDNPEKRIFFSNKSYLPSETPSGLRHLRQKELETLRGNGQGERKTFERIYDYDTYNDLGDPDSSDDLVRPVLGGKEHPYPRRCRTGRARSKKDPSSETRGSVYVPRDEAFSEVKQATFTGKTLESVLQAAGGSVGAVVIDTNLGFPFFKTIDALFNEGLPLPKSQSGGGLLQSAVRLVSAVRDSASALLLFDTPDIIERDSFSWLRDEEFARQTLSGVNPMAIQLVTEFPLVSKLDPEIYGPPESAITKEAIEREIKGIMTVEEAIKLKKLFILDYHDLFLPFVNKVRELENTTLYGSRTLFFLTEKETLTPVAIELTRPASPDKPQWKRVFYPGMDAANDWLWRLAKAHVTAHCSGYHELVSHWLRTHCCAEPYVIATNRQLSVMHPIYKLLRPHLRYTMEINALARQFLISGNGIIEYSFSPKKYSMTVSSDAYDKLWRFDMEALPADLIRRGMAVEDPTAEHGLNLTIKDYPYANDGLLIWSTIKQWVTDYVTHYYPNSSSVSSDLELQAWWTEIRTKGHGDKQDEPWWPILKATNDLIQILTTIIWVASAHHAAVNFVQYAYGGYFPNRPSIARTNIPVEDESSEELAQFWHKPHPTLLQCFPSQVQATLVMAILAVLSYHSPDEEYLGGKLESAWKEDPVIYGAFTRYNSKMKEIEGIIDARNRDVNLRNRNGVGIIPYEVLKPFSESGVTGMGIPNSVSI